MTTPASGPHPSSSASSPSQEQPAWLSTWQPGATNGPAVDTCSQAEADAEGREMSWLLPRLRLGGFPLAVACGLAWVFVEDGPHRDTAVAVAVVSGLLSVALYALTVVRMRQIAVRHRQDPPR